MADPSTAPPLVSSTIADAHAKVKPYVHVTPLITSRSMDAIASHPDPSVFLSQTPPPVSNPSTATTNGHSTSAPTPKFNLYFKCENEQKIGAFKARGAHHAIIRLVSIHGIEYLRSRGVTTHSSGNHAQAIALAARNFDIPSYIVMPSISTPSKIAGTRMYTENVMFSGPTFADREATIAKVIEKTGAILIPPFDHPDIIIGQGTASYEMEQQYREMKLQEPRQSPPTTTSNGTDSTILPEPRFDAVLTPLGGGGLLGGTATWLSHTASPPNTKRTLVFGCEPSFSGANDAQLGLAADPPTRIPHVQSLTIADGLRTPVGALNWTIVSDPSKVHGVFSVTERQIKDALRLMMERVKVFVEPSAVVPVAVVLFCGEFRSLVAERQRLEGGRPWDVGIVLSGGNTTVEAVARLFAAEDGAEETKMERQTAEVGMNGERKAEDVAG